MGSLEAYPEITSTFKFIADHPFAVVDTNSPIFSQLERFTVVLCDKTSVIESVNEARREQFYKKNRNLENLPPKQNALAQYIKRVEYQAGIWTNGQRLQMQHMQCHCQVIGVGKQLMESGSLYG